MPTKSEAAIIKKALDAEKNNILKFQLKKTLRLAASKIKKINLKVDFKNFIILLQDNTKIDDLALAILTLNFAEAFLAADAIRKANWQTFPEEILPSFCLFFKKYGGFEDVQTLLELTRHYNPIILSSAIDALETIDPTNLQGIIEPLLNSPNTDMKAQAIQVLYKWNKKEAIKHFVELMFSKNTSEKALALHYADFFVYKDIEPHLIRLLVETADTTSLMRISKIFVKNANKDLPFRIFWINKNLQGEQQSLIKGIILAVIRELQKKEEIHGSVQDYLTELKYKVNTFDQTKEESKKSSKDDEQTSSIVKETVQESEEIKENNHIEKQEFSSNDIENYKFLAEKDKIKFLAKINVDYFNANRAKLQAYMTLAMGKELASFISLMGKFGDENDAEKIKTFCRSENPDIVCSSIKALAKLDSEFLCLYLPQFLQQKNGKIRMTATRVFAEIDSERIESLLTSMISSQNTKQRTIGVSTSMLLDFNIVKKPLINALAKENSLELIEKISTVLASNPEKETLYQVYKIAHTTRISEKNEMDNALKIIAEKLSVTLNHEKSPDDLIKEAAKKFEIEKNIQKEERIQSLKKINKTEDLKTGKNKEKIDKAEKAETIKEMRTKATVVILILAAIAWGILCAYILMWLLGG
ncbi:MAG: hypothetical protein PHQ02_04500 [Candidatus Riflebacteria bacterium]|nr:hypothetical protein [Candidatus Riflebacteria bacterium]